MQTVTFNCEVITPMFLGGADQQPELRPPSIRGAMRWWFRAMMGGIIGNNIPDLQKLEMLVFGSNDQSSAITTKCKSYVVKKNKYARLPHKPKGSKAERNAIDINQQVTIELKLNPWVHETKDEIFNIACESLKLLLNFGGLGNRARRGFGSLYWSSGKDEKEILSDANKVFNDFISKMSISKIGWSTIPTFPCIHQSYFNVFETNTDDGWETKLITLMQEMSAFKVPTNDGRNATGWAERGNRQGSPLIVHAKKTDDGKIKLLFSHFRTILNSYLSVTDSDRDNLEKIITANFKATQLTVF